MILLPIGTDVRLRRRPTVNYVLMAANVAFFVIFDLFASRAGVVPLMMLKRAMMLWPGSPDLWQFLTYQFLHANFWHLLGNMWFLWIFGNAANSKLGNVTYLLIYLAGGVFAGFGFALGETQLPCLGASGAVAGITTVYLALFPRNIVRMFYWIFWFIGDFEIRSLPLILFKMIFWDNVLAMNLPAAGARSVAYAAHLAGYSFGFAAMLLLLWIGAVRRDPFDILSLWSRWRRRRQFAHVASETEAAVRRQVGVLESPQARSPAADEVGPIPTARPVGADRAQVDSLRHEIARAIDNFDLPGAARLYKKLIELDSSQVLGPSQQLDVANQLTAEGDYTSAAEAYEKFLQRDVRDTQARQVMFLLGVIYARHLDRFDRAAECLEQSREGLTDPNQIAQCEHWLQVVRSRMGGQDIG